MKLTSVDGLNLDKDTILWTGKVLTHYQMTNFRLVQIETNCRRYFKVHLKRKISTVQGRKHCKKRRNCLLQAVFPFLTMFSIAINL